MNRKQLDALLRAGLITQEQHTEHVTMLAAGEQTRPVIHTTLPASIRLDEHDGDRNADAPVTIHADIITRYDELIVSHGMIIHTGALQAREPLSRVKLLRDHYHEQPLGFMTSLSSDGLAADFQVAPREAARVLEEIADGTRDGLSVGFTTWEYEIDDDWILHVLKADFYEVSLCAIPAVQEAGVTSVAAAMAALTHQGKEHPTMNREQLAAALAAGTITQAEHDRQLAALEAADAAGLPPLAPTVPLALAAGPEQLQQQPAPLVTRDRGLSMDAAVSRIVQAAQTGQPRAVIMAIADVLPADDAGGAFLQEEWLGPLFRAEDARRPWIEAIGTPEPLTALKGKGWNWVEGRAPEVEEYAGNKTEVPSNPIDTESDLFTAWRIAAGWDVDRAFIDFADPEFTRSFLEAVAKSYRRKSNAGTRTRVLAAAKAPGAITAAAGGTATVAAGGVLAILKQVRRDIRKVDGGRANRFFLGATLWDEFEDLDYQTLPLWLRTAQVGMDFSEETATIGNTALEHDSTLAPLQVAAFDNRALKIKERSPFQIYADNIPKGGVDIGVFSYMRLDAHDKRLIVKRTYGEALPV